MFPMEDFLLWVTTNHGERGKKNTLSGGGAERAVSRMARDN